ncbi:MAG TPA: helix-turn-helix transcriptional regulator [Candidatus Merdenecus merdavium]|nr:helix-turn-helix transcriptional regulator [Candidatus Merdenecus merdavium]
MFIKERLKLLEEFLCCCHEIYFWIYDTSLKLQDSSYQNPLILDAIFSASKCKTYLWDYIQSHTLPVFLYDQESLMWIAVMEKNTLDESIQQIHIMGPFFINESALPELKKQIRQKSISIKMQREAEKILETIPTISSSNLFQYTLMLEYCVNGHHITIDQIHHQQNDSETFFGRVDGNSEAETSHTSLHLGVNTIERRMLTMIEDGNLNYSSVLESAALISNGVQMKGNTSLRRGKNSSIIFITLASRAAIKGGLPPATAYNLCDFYTDMVENSKTMSELANLNHTMYDDFIRRVHSIKRAKEEMSLSTPILTCCDYIKMHVCEKISVSSLAKLVGYAEYYLTKKFKKETGLSINEYINQKKIEHAKLLLSASDHNIQDISQELNYSSRSYFTRVFQEQTGLSPSEYRNTYHQTGDI